MIEGQDDEVNTRAIRANHIVRIMRAVWFALLIGNIEQHDISCIIRNLRIHMERITRHITKLRMRDALIIFIGTTIMSIAVKWILDPAGLVTGGVSGLAIVIKELTGGLVEGGIPLWISNVVLNVPIFLFAIYAEGFRSIIRTGLSWVIMSVELAVLPDLSLIADNYVLTTAYGGILFGVGTGLLLSVYATSGGTDLLGKALHKYLRSVSMGRLIQILDGAVVIVGAIVFSIEQTLYAIIAVYIMGKLTDMIIDSGKRAKIALIISDENQGIASDILEDLDRGVTGLRARGMYTGNERTVLICICSKHDIPYMKDIVREHDKKAFFIIGSISEAMGEGFVEHWK